MLERILQDKEQAIFLKNYWSSVLEDENNDLSLNNRRKIERFQELLSKEYL